jgi:hypothetical protein
MRITNCVPLAGQGVVARHGLLVAVTDGCGTEPDPMLAALSEVAAAAGDGGDLVLKAARAALGPCGQAAWACAGVIADGGVAVLVHGRAVATVQVEDGPDVTLTASGSMLPVSRTFAGSTVVVSLAVGAPAPPDPRFWLGDGVMPGGGLAVTVSAGVAGPAEVPPAVVDPVDARGDANAWDGADTWGGADGWGDANAWGGGDGLAGVPAEDPLGGHPPTMDTPAIGTPPVFAPPADTLAGEVSPHDAVLVDGVLCARDHFNDPGAWSCRRCGIGLDQPPRDVRRGPRPPLGVLEIDDGTKFTLDGDYVLGREPTLDGDVLAGRARPLRINDPNGTVSRLHLKISLVGWQVEVSDLGSANGSVLQAPDEERTLTPFEPAIIEPGARIGIGHRSMQYLAYQGVLP